MKRVASTFGQALSLGIAALALATGPTFAFGIPINTPAGSVPPVSGAVNPPAPAVNPATVPSDSVPTLVQLPAQYSPHFLDLGTLKGYRNEQRRATLTITAPADGTVSAFMLPQGGPIQVTALSCAAPGGVGVLRPVVWTANGSGQLEAQTGDQVQVEVTIRANAHLPDVLNALLEVVSHRWHVEVPVRALVLAQPEIVVEPRTGEFKIVPGHDAAVTVHLRRTLSLTPTGPSGADRDIVITAASLPPGITMEPVPVRLPVDAAFRDANLVFHASEATPVGRDQAVSLRIDTGVDRYSLDLAAQVYPAQVSFPFEYAVGDSLKVKGEMLVRWDGSWRWLEDLESDESVVGDHYFTSVFFQLPYYNPSTGEDEWIGVWDQGEIGGVEGHKKVHVEKSSADFPTGPLNAWMQQNYFDIVDTGFELHSTSRTDISGFSEWLADQAGGPIIDLIKGTITG